MESSGSNKKIIFVVAMLGIVSIALLGYVFRSAFFPVEKAPQTPDKQIRVLTTFFPLYDFTRNVGKDRIRLDILFSQTPEVASFSPADIQKVNNADMIIKNGAGLEPVLDEVIQSSDNKDVVVVDTSKGVELSAEGSEEGEAANPHIWLDPQRAMIQVTNIRDALVNRDPANADFYTRNAEEYIRQLQGLDRDTAQRTSAFHKKEFVAFHPAFVYFARRYGLRQAAVIEEFPGKEPSPQYIAEVMKTIRDLRINAVFAEPQFSPRVAEVIASDLGIQLRTLDPIETGDAQKDSYISIMRKNLQTLEDVLK